MHAQLCVLGPPLVIFAAILSACMAFVPPGGRAR